jgi:hypothetical protein
MPELHTFETLAEDSAGTLDRLSVAGGWLYRTRTWDNRSNTFATSLAYVPDGQTLEGGPAPPAAPGTCFWYANLAAADLTGTGEWAVLTLGPADAYGNTDLFADADGGFAVVGNAMVAIDLWCEFEAPPASGAQIGVQIDKAGTLLTRGQVQLLPGLQSIGRTFYQGLLQDGHIVRAGALIAAGDVPGIMASSYITAHIVSS